jgi:mannose-6-phosphate isomerase
MVALSEFWLLHGFKSPEKLNETLTNVPELNELLPLFHEKGNEGLFQYIMELPQDEVNRILKPLIDKIIIQFNNGSLSKHSEDHWAAKAAIHFTKNGNIDRGIFSVYFFNLVHLKTGEAIFQGPGIPHAYLEGQNVEIMANSDNVLRGGLTSKHIDVKELLKNINSGSVAPYIIIPETAGGVKNYKTSATEFSLTMFELKTGEKIELDIAVPGILLLTTGCAQITGSNRSLLLEQGQPSAIILPHQKITINASENAVVFHASGPVNSGV